MLQYALSGTSAPSYSLGLGDNGTIAVEFLRVPVKGISMEIKTDKEPTPAMYLLEVACDQPGVVYYHNTLRKENSAIGSLIDFKQQLLPGVPGVPDTPTGEDEPSEPASFAVTFS